MKLLFSIIFIVFGNSIAYGSSFKSKIDKAKKCSKNEIEQIKCLKSILENNPNIEYDTIALIHYSIAFRYRKIDQYNNSIDHSLLAHKYYNTQDPCITTAQKNLRLLALNYDDIDQKDSTLIYLDMIDYFMPPSSDSWAYMESASRYSGLLLKYELYQAAEDLISPLLFSHHYNKLNNAEKLSFLYNSMKLYKSNPERYKEKKVKQLLDESRSISINKEDEQVEYIKIELEYGQYLLKKGNYKNVLNEWKNLFDRFSNVKSSDCKKELTKVLINMAYVAEKLGSYDAMHEYALKSLKYADLTNTQNKYARRLNYAVSLMYRDKYKESISEIDSVFSILGLKKFDDTIDNSVLFEVYNTYLDFTRIHLHFDNVDEALRTFRYMIKIAYVYIDSRYFEKSKFPVKKQMFEKTASLLDSLSIRKLDLEFIELAELLNSTVLMDNISLDKVYVQKFAEAIKNFERDYSNSKEDLNELILYQRQLLGKLVGSDFQVREKLYLPELQSTLNSEEEIWLFQYTFNHLYMICLLYTSPSPRD